MPDGLLGSEGRASAYQAEGHRFESRRSPLFLLPLKNAALIGQTRPGWVWLPWTLITIMSEKFCNDCIATYIGQCITCQHSVLADFEHTMKHSYSSLQKYLVKMTLSKG